MGKRATFGEVLVIEGTPIEPAVEFFDDFLEGGYVADAGLTGESDPGAKFSQVANGGAWLVTVTDGGGDNAETIAIADDEPGGVAAFTTNDADDDSLEMQLNGEAFKVQDGKDIEFACRLKLNDVDTADWFVGLATTDTAVIDGTTESIGFRNASNSADIRYVCEDAAAETTDDSGQDLSDDTFVTLAFRVISNTKVKFYVDGEFVGQSVTNIPDGDAVTLTLAVQNASAAASTLEVDWLYCRQVR